MSSQSFVKRPARDGVRRTHERELLDQWGAAMAIGDAVEVDRVVSESHSLRGAALDQGTRLGDLS